MKSSIFVRLLSLAVIIIAGLNMAFLLFGNRVKDELIQAYELRNITEIAMYEIQLASEELTRLARSYITTGARRNYYSYWEALLVDDRVGQARQVFIDNYFTDPDAGLIAAHRTYVDRLRAVDAKAFAARAAGEYQLAVEIMHSQDYMIYAFGAREVTYEIRSVLEAHVQGLIDSAERASAFFNMAGLSTVMLLAVLCVLSTVAGMRLIRAREQKMNERLRLMIEAAPVAITFFNGDAVAIDCNTEAARIFGCESKEEYISNFNNLMPDVQPDGRDSKQFIDGLVLEAHKTGEAQAAEVFLLKTDGTPVFVETKYIRVPYANGYAVIEYAQDLSALKEAHDSAKELVDASPLFIEIWDEEFNIIDCNDKTMVVLGLKDKTEYIQRHADFAPKYQPCGLPSADKAQAMLNKVMQAGYVDFEWLHIDAKGNEVPVATTFVKIMRKGKPILVGYNLDLRNIKIAEEENRAKSRFLAQVSHEIRTPMNAILGITEIQLQSKNISPETEEAFIRIFNSSHMLLALINNLLDLSKADEKKMEIICMPYELASLIVDIVQLNTMYIGSKQIKFKLSVDPELPAKLMGDELRVKQIISNILSNAFKYTDKGTVEISFAAALLANSKLKNGINLIVNVADTGRGMSQEQVRRLFSEEYIRFNQESSNTIGTGLGLAIMYRLVKMMNGKIAVESEPGKGSRVTVHIPQEAHGTDIVGAEMAQNLQRFESISTLMKRNQNINYEPLPYGRVLIVDDAEYNLYVAKGLMLPYRLTVETAESGFEAINKVKGGNIYDIIFMDHMMPEMDGMETVKRLRDMGYSAPIVALTANALVGQSEIFLKNGFSGFISKPIDTRLLDNCLHRFIRDKQSPEVIEATRAEMQTNGPADRVQDRELARLFVRGAGRIAAALDAVTARQPLVLDTQILKEISLHTHTIKSMLRDIGEPELGNVAADLEQAAKNGDTDALAVKIQGFTARLREVVKALTPESTDAVYEADEAQHTVSGNT